VIFIVVPRGETKKREWGLIPRTDARVQSFLQAFQDKGNRQEGILSCLQMLGDVLNKQQAQVDQDTGYPYELPQQPPCLSGSIASNPVHLCTGFIQFHQQALSTGMVQAAL
jgi:hypothetical protein